MVTAEGSRLRSVPSVSLRLCVSDAKLIGPSCLLDFGQKILDLCVSREPQMKYVVFKQW